MLLEVNKILPRSSCESSFVLTSSIVLLAKEGEAPAFNKLS